jgi:hypothetical protein
MLMVKALLRAAKKTKKAVKKAKKAKKGTQDLFADRFVSRLDEGQAPSRGTLDVEAGKAGKVTRGKKSFPRMDEAASKGSRKRAKKVKDLGIAARTDPEAKAKLDKMDAASKKSDKARVAKATITRDSEARKDKGVSVQGMEGIERIGAKPKFKDSDMMVGNTTNGITKDGEIVGNPTDNQIAIVVRNLEARKRLSTDAKRNLAKLKRMSKRQRQDRAINRLNRDIRDTGPDRKNKGGLMKAVHTDMRKSGLFR